MKNIAILGSTGSIGRQTMDVVSQHRDLFHVSLVSANNSVELLASQAKEAGASHAVICNEARYKELCEALEGSGIQAHAGMDALCALVAEPEIDCVVTSMVGFSGLRSTLAAVEASKTIALANKETLVAAGSIVMPLAAARGSKILPVDSEHSAIFQCLKGNEGQKISKIHLTASGGPFRTWERSAIAAAGASDALKHPNWSMGAKITIDSATMMNKGLEVIEAKWLFDVEADRIKVVVHPQSIIHSMVEYEDGAVIAQLGHPDMREPIQYALGYPDRLPLNNHKLDFASLGKLEFFDPDYEKFPCLGLAFEALRRGGSCTAIMNAANEVAVEAYLQGKIGFYDINDIIEKSINGMEIVAAPSIDDIFEADKEARAYARTLIK